MKGAQSPSFFSEVGCLPLPLCYLSVAGGKRSCMEQGPEAGKKHCWALSWLQHDFLFGGRVPKGSVTVPILTLGSSVQGMRSGRGQGPGIQPLSYCPAKNRARRKAGSRRGGLLPSLLSRGRPLSLCWREEPPAGRAPSHIGHLIPQLCIFLLLFVIILL